MRQCILLALAFGAASLQASVVYNLRDGRYFPDGPNPSNTYDSNPFTATTTDSLVVSYSSDPGNPAADTFDGTASVNTGPFTLGTQNSLTLGTDTTTYQSIGILSIVQSGIQDSSILVTGGTGTGYLLPTFHVFGTESNSNPNANVEDEICAGNASCILSDIFGPTTSGNRSVDGTYTPQIGSSTSFTFGTPFSFFFFFGSGIQGSGSAGGTSTADLTLQFDGFQLVDASGTPIQGAHIQSQFLDAMVPEPGTLPVSLTAVILLGIFAARRRHLGV